MVACVSVALQAAIVYLWHAKNAVLVANFIVPPLFVAIVNAFTFADLDGETTADTWLRILERSWAVLIVDLLLTFLVIVGFVYLESDDFFARALGAVMIVLYVSMIFADVHATTGEAEPWWLLIPRSFGASMAAAWQRAAFSRAMICFVAITLLPTAIVYGLEAAFGQRHVPHADLWANAVTVALALPPTQAFCALVYLDAIGYESKRSCGE